jgi:hypothetical protein
VPHEAGDLNLKKNRRWIDAAVLGTAIGFFLSSSNPSLRAVAAGAESGPPSQPLASLANGAVFEGMITCSRCGAKHRAAFDRAADACVRVCVHGGATFALIDAETTYLLDGDLDALKRLSGQRARIVGILNGQTIKVLSAAAS